MSAAYEHVVVQRQPTGGDSKFALDINPNMRNTLWCNYVCDEVIVCSIILSHI